MKCESLLTTNTFSNPTYSTQKIGLCCQTLLAALTKFSCCFLKCANHPKLKRRRNIGIIKTQNIFLLVVNAFKRIIGRAQWGVFSSSTQSLNMKGGKPPMPVRPNVWLW